MAALSSAPGTFLRVQGEAHSDSPIDNLAICISATAWKAAAKVVAAP